MKNKSFDEKTIIEIGAYVYALFDPTEARPFYIGKGRGNRVFQHVEGAIKEDKKSNKYDKIREIKSRDSNNRVSHCVVRHGMSDKVAFEVESALIDLANMTGANLTNEVTGHNAIENGIMQVDDIIWKYNAQPLNNLAHRLVIINISGSYKKIRDNVVQANLQNTGKDLIYESVKKAWRIGPNRENIEYVLAEYKGIIVEVYEIIEVKNNDGKVERWYQCPEFKPVRWGFHGRIAKDEVRDNYVNKSIAHHKKPGTANPIRYSLN